MPAALVGIDFGTAITRAVRWAPGDEWPGGVVSIPSLALARPEGLRVGDVALEGAATQPEGLICGLKRLLERTPEDEVARSVAARCGATLQLPGARLHLRTAKDAVLAVDSGVAALLHQAGAQVAGAEQDDRIAVITIPEWYDGPQQGALRRAANHAGLKVLRFIGDMAAMGLWLAHEDSSERTLAIVNAGAGGTCVTVVSINPDDLYIASNVSDRHWGGDDVTASLVDAAMVDAPDSSPATRELLRQAIDSLRPQLAAREQVEASVQLSPPGAEPVQHTFLLEQSQFEPALAVARKSIAQTCEEALDDAELEQDDIDAVYATGGMSVFPAVAAQIAEVFGGEVQRHRRYENYPALGAAYEAAILSSQTKGPLVLDGLSTGRMQLPVDAS